MDYWLLMGIAVWRLTRMLHTERGPLDIFLRMRAALAKRQRRSGGLYDLVSCPFCLSIWVAAIFSLFLAGNLLTFVVNTLILSGIASLIHELIAAIKNDKL